MTFTRLSIIGTSISRPTYFFQRSSPECTAPDAAIKDAGARANQILKDNR
jgi:hypothetical protein